MLIKKVITNKQHQGSYRFIPYLARSNQKKKQRREEKVRGQVRNQKEI